MFESCINNNFIILHLLKRLSCRCYVVPYALLRRSLCAPYEAYVEIRLTGLPAERVVCCGFSQAFHNSKEHENP
jgi:hypothetical protein